MYTNSLRPQEGLQSPAVQGLERDLGDVLDLRNDFAWYPEVRLQTGLHGEQLPQRGDARDDLHGVEHDYAAPQEVDEAYDKVVYFRGRDVGHQDFLKVTCKPQYGHHARLGEVVEGALVVQAARDPQAAHDEAGLGEHAEDVGGAALELPRFGDAREGGGGLVGGGWVGVSEDVAWKWVVSKQLPPYPSPAVSPAQYIGAPCRKK